jgi:hypothetical protein
MIFEIYILIGKCWKFQGKNLLKEILLLSLPDCVFQLAFVLLKTMEVKLALVLELFSAGLTLPTTPKVISSLTVLATMI